MSNQPRLFMRHIALLTTLVALAACQTTTTTLSTSSTQPTSLADKNYTALQKALPMYEYAAAHPWPIIPANTTLKLGAKNAGVPLLRDRLKATGDLLPDNDYGDAVFDRQLADAVMNFQERNGLKADGVVGADTLHELNISAQERLKQIQLNIQRWAILSKQMGDHYVLVNIPDYHLYVIDHDQKVLTMKAIVGKTERPTPEISSTITTIVLNPRWNVPKLIANKDIVPKVIADPTYLEKMHIKILNRQEETPTEIDPQTINWQLAETDGFPYHFRQDPGPDNALGLVKFEFQNSEDVYLHDTPTKNLFDEDKRHFSSGCIRLEHPFELVTYLMKEDPEWNSEKEQQILAMGKTTYVRAATPTPVFITYLTAWVDDSGKIEFRDDVYGRDMSI
jgi:murein L,D-transpeptidase YcbB/YkuD